MEAPDEQLMVAYRDGDPGAFEKLYTRHKGPLFRFVLRSLKERATAEELFQEVWMRVIEARARYRPQARESLARFLAALEALPPAQRAEEAQRGGGR